MTRIQGIFARGLTWATLVGWAFGLAASQPGLFPPIEPAARGHLRVSDRHEIYWETCGNPDGLPVIVLHGGPGGKTSPRMRRFFDPARFFIILHDQRGAGHSRPAAEWRENSTPDLVADINRLRDHLGVDGRAIVWGGSWGSTLALAYAEAHPERVSGLVLRGVFLATSAEIDHFYHGGAALLFPDSFKRLQDLVPNPDSFDYPAQLFALTQSADPAVRQRAIRGWAAYEFSMASVTLTEEQCRAIVETNDLTSFSVLENHYMKHGCFLAEGQILQDVDRIAHLPVAIVNGRFDIICPPRTAHRLAEKLENVRLSIVTGAGHSDRDEGMAEALVASTIWVADQVAATQPATVPLAESLP